MDEKKVGQNEKTDEFLLLTPRSPDTYSFEETCQGKSLGTKNS